ncbi:MAG: elongation factor [Desulfovibrionales bacterium]|nr:elongation factor [Desulfovibrionales bacterium]
MSEALNQQRTYALVGHGGSGKTSLAEMILKSAGAISRLGKVEEGTTALDYEPEEIKRRGSIQPGFANFQWSKNTHFLIDTPGDNNFCGDLPYTLAAADAAVLVIDAVDGAKPLTKNIWKAVKGAGLPSLCVINKMDRDRADFDMAFSSLSDVLGAKPALLYMPIGQKEDFKGVVDLLGEKAILFGTDGEISEAEIPADMADEAAALRETMVENIAESDEELMEKYLEEGELTLEEIKQGLAMGVKSGELTPVVVAAATADMGGALILDAVQALFPSALEHAAWQGEDGAQLEVAENGPLACFAFKTLVDPFAGQLTVMRVLSGTLSPDSTLANPKKDAKERIGSLLLTVGKEQTQSKAPAGPGAIVTVAKLKETATGDTLCGEKQRFTLKNPTLPPKLITYALAPAEKGEEDKVYTAVQKLLDEDISLSLTRDEESADILLSGMGQNHIEISVERAKRRSKASILLKTPKVPYRETIKGKADVQGRYKKQTGGRGQFGDCFIKLEPQPKGAGYEFVDAIVGGAIPRQFIPAVDKGVQEAAARGVLAGYPLVDFKVTLYDGSYHTVDSSEMAFKVAGSMAFKKACEQASVVLLEPIMTVSVSVPDEYMGDVIGDLSSRRGKVLGSDSQGGVTEIKAHTPMSEVLQYAPDLRSMTGGQGTFTMEFAHYEEAPPFVTDKVVAASKQEAE